MALETRGALYALVLEPPGNEARELSLFRRRIFSALGDASALAFPDAAPLAFGLRLRSAAGPKLRLSRSALVPALSALWKECPGGFASADEASAAAGGGSAAGGLVEAGGSLYLGLGPSFGTLAAAAAASLGGLGLRPLAAEGAEAARGSPPCPWRAGLGFFVCGRSSLEAAAALSPPALSFFDSALALYRLEPGPDPFQALSWRAVAEVKRLSGPRRGRGSDPRP